MWVRGLRPDELWIVVAEVLHGQVRASLLRAVDHLCALNLHLGDHADGVPICWQWLGHGEGQCLNRNVRCAYQIINFKNEEVTFFSCLWFVA